MSEYTIMTVHGTKDGKAVSIGAYAIPPYFEDGELVEPGESVGQALQRAIETAKEAGVVLDEGAIGASTSIVNSEAESFNIKIIDTIAVRNKSIQDKVTGDWSTVPVVDFYHRWNNGWGEYCEFSAYINDDKYKAAFDEAMKPLGLSFEELKAKAYTGDAGFKRDWNGGQPSARPEEIVLAQPVVFMPDNPARNASGQINFVNLVRSDEEAIEWPTAAWSKPYTNQKGEEKISTKYQPKWYNGLRNSNYSAS